MQSGRKWLVCFCLGMAAFAVVGLMMTVKAKTDAQDHAPLQVGDTFVFNVQTVAHNERMFSISTGEPEIVQGRETCTLSPKMPVKILWKDASGRALVKVLIRPDSLSESDCGKDAMVTVLAVPLHDFIRYHWPHSM